MGSRLSDPREILAPENLGEFKKDWCKEKLGIDEQGFFMRDGKDYRVIIDQVFIIEPKPVPNNPSEPEPMDGKKPIRHGPKEGMMSRILRRFGK